MCLLKFDYFFFMAFSVQLVLLVPSVSPLERVLTVIALPTTLLLLLIGYYGVRREIKAVTYLFMLGLLGIGVTLLLGVAMRIGTAAGALMYAFMYAAVLPLENNPVVDDHLVGVIVMAVLALGAAGTTWGLGHWWNRIPVVEEHPVLR